MTALSYSFTTCMIRQRIKFDLCRIPFLSNCWGHLEAEPGADWEGDDDDEEGKGNYHLKFFIKKMSRCDIEQKIKT